jgi:hypothetical protein
VWAICGRTQKRKMADAKLLAQALAQGGTERCHADLAGMRRCVSTAAPACHRSHCSRRPSSLFSRRVQPRSISRARKKPAQRLAELAYIRCARPPSENAIDRGGHLGRVNTRPFADPFDAFRLTLSGLARRLVDKLQIQWSTRNGEGGRPIIAMVRGHCISS